MAKRTYAPTFVALLKRICVYIVRYQNTLVGGLTDAGVSNASTKVAAVVAACEAITAEYDAPIGD